MTKVVVTGLGMTTPLGGDVPSTWEAALAGRSGVRTLDNDWVARYGLAGWLLRSGRRSPGGGPDASRNEAHGPLRANGDRCHSRGVGRRRLT